MLESPNKTVDENWEDFKSVLLKGMNMFIPKGKKISYKIEEKRRRTTPTRDSMRGIYTVPSLSCLLRLPRPYPVARLLSCDQQLNRTATLRLEDFTTAVRRGLAGRLGIA